MANERLDSPGEAQPQPECGDIRYNCTFSPVIVNEVVGSVFLGVISIILVIALLRVLVCNRELEAQLSRRASAT